jgi:hypothetical protein
MLEDKITEKIIGCAIEVQKSGLFLHGKTGIFRINSPAILWQRTGNIKIRASAQKFYSG